MTAADLTQSKSHRQEPGAAALTKVYRRPRPRIQYEHDTRQDPLAIPIVRWRHHNATVRKLLPPHRMTASPGLQLDT